MADWYYYNASNERIGPVRGRELKQLVRQGMVTQETLVEDEKGHTARAKNIIGLPFHEVVQPKAEQSDSTIIANPPAEANPFTDALPVLENPFTVSMPAEPNPFVAAPPARKQQQAKPQSVSVPVVIPSDAPSQRARVQFWTMLCILSFVLWIVTSLVQNSLNFAGNSPEAAKHMEETEELTAEDLMELGTELGLTAIVLSFPIAYLFCYFFYIRRLWETIPEEFARTTPVKAALLMLIPCFNLYWQFVAFWGLYKDMNKTTESYGHGSCFNESPILIVCVGPVVAIIVVAAYSIYCDANGLQPFNSLFLIGVHVLTGIIVPLVYWIVSKDVLSFIDIKSGVREPGTVSPIASENAGSPWTTLIGILAILAVGGIGWTIINANSPGGQMPKDSPIRQRQCSNNIRKTVLAFHDYYDNFNSIPPLYTIDKDGKPLHSWRVLILPLLGEQKLYEQIRLDEPWDSNHNRQFHNQMPAVYQCPSNRKGCCYSVIAGECFLPGTDSGKYDRIQDGPSNTLAIIEVKEGFCWMDPTADITLDELVKGINAGRVGSYHSGGINAALFDGSVRFISNSIDKRVLRALGTRNGGESVVPPWSQ